MQQQQQGYYQPQSQQGGFNGQQPGPHGGGGGGRGFSGRGRGRGGRGPSYQPELPQGWDLASTPEGHPYYINHNDRSTHWELPASVQSQMYHKRGIDGAKRKTKMCQNYELGQCRWGDNCAFAHNAQELVAPVTNANQQPPDPQQQQQQQQ